MLGGFGFSNLDRYGRQGVDALARMTPRESGRTADAWSYEIERRRGRVAIYWRNNHIEDGVNIAVIIQYGHGTGTGGWVEGIDYINPAMRSIFDNIVEGVWKEVTRA